MKYILIFWACYSFSVDLIGQHQFVWLYLKPDTEPQEVLDLYQDDELEHYYSPWLHAIGARMDKTDILKLSATDLIIEVTGQNHFTYQNSSEVSPNLGFALEQIGANIFIERGLDGQGVKIGVIDGGFLKADEIEPLAHLFQDSLIKAYRDYITPELTPYEGIKALDDRHGTDVLQLIGGSSRTTGVIHGLATASEYYLARTDHGASEKKIEEMYLIQALEWLDSLGVKLVNISLGYTDGFMSESDNYHPEDMNGKSAIAKAIDHAFDQEGMLVIVSSGNDGDRDWRVLSTPADARRALTVGATKFNHWDKMAYSSVGSEGLLYLKPEISCFASEGTSFSAPIITGLAALIWQADPSLTNTEVKEIVIRSGHLYPYGNNYVGYGVPIASRVLQQLDNQSLSTPERIKVYGKRYKIPSRPEAHYVVYQKSDQWNVMEEIYMQSHGNKPKIQRMDKAAFTTVIIDNTEVYEIEWMKE